MPPIDTPMECPGTLESHWERGPWVNATSRPIQIPREALNTASRCQLSSMKPGRGTTVSIRGESHTAGMEARTINNTARKSAYGATRSLSQFLNLSDGAELASLATGLSFFTIESSIPRRSRIDSTKTPGSCHGKRLAADFFVVESDSCHTRNPEMILSYLRVGSVPGAPTR